MSFKTAFFISLLFHLILISVITALIPEKKNREKERIINLAEVKILKIKEEEKVKEIKENPVKKVNKEVKKEIKSEKKKVAKVNKKEKENKVKEKDKVKKEVKKAEEKKATNEKNIEKKISKPVQEPLKNVEKTVSEKPVETVSYIPPDVPYSLDEFEEEDEEDYEYETYEEENENLEDKLELIVSAIYKYIEYPYIAREMGWEGTVKVAFTLLPDGSVENLRIVESSGYEVLDNTALETVLKASKEFPKVGERIDVIVPIEYTLE